MRKISIFRCDADPPALSRYVIALLKKDKPPKALSQCMAEQLDVFLGSATLPFLDKLFIAIQTEEYLNEIPLTPADNEGGVTTAAVATSSGSSGAIDETITASSDAYTMQGSHEHTPPLEVNLFLFN